MANIADPHRLSIPPKATSIHGDLQSGSTEYGPSEPLGNDTPQLISQQDWQLKSRKRPYSHVSIVTHNHREVSGRFYHVELDQDLTSGGRDPHDQKRSRPADWRPEDTPNLDQRNQPATPHVKYSKDTLSPHKKQDSPNSGRASKFLEGSMHDRASNKPPSLYVKEEQAMDRYLLHEDAGQIREFTHHPNHSISHSSAGLESTKQSSIFRFGKAVASAFNPVNIWQGLNGRRKETQERSGHPEREILKERQVKAEKAYAELKKSGFKGTHRVVGVHHNTEVPLTKHELDIQAATATIHLDSGVDVDGYQSSTERNLEGRVFTDNDYLLPPPSISGFGRSASPASDLSSGKRSSLHLRTPSLQSLKKAKSYFQTPSVKRQSEPLALPLAVGSNASSHEITNERAVKKQSSRKDLEKQQKLGKKVSDLEAKLNGARRELQLAMSNDAMPPPSQIGRKPFKPGALPSLPSEGVLHQKDNDGKDEEVALTGAQTDVSKSSDAALAASIARGARTGVSSSTTSGERGATFAARAAIQVEQHQKATPKKPVSKKRKSSGEAGDDVRYKPDTEDDDDVEWEAAKTASNQKSVRPKKSRKVAKEGSPVYSENKAGKGTQHTSVLKGDLISKAGSPRHLEKEFEPETVDKDKIISMRSKTKPDIPFGQLSDDVINIRKEYPSITDEELVNYIASLLHKHKLVGKEETNALAAKASLDSMVEEKGNTDMADRTIDRQLQESVQEIAAPRTLRKIYSEKTLTQHTSVAHPNQPPPAFLGRPRSASPMKKDGEHSLRPTSPPQSLKYAISNAEPSVNNENVVSVSQAMDEDIPPVPKVPTDLQGNVKPVKSGGNLGKALPEVQKEDYEWPEDVF
ncbi:MAG: hypothetical protein M1830_000496 [Pleopsidium flavum]|nr:MAG: hypothetical protein M1830_000496 [Pleopsidium flavum]